MTLDEAVDFAVEVVEGEYAGAWEVVRSEEEPSFLGWTAYLVSLQSDLGEWLTVRVEEYLPGLFRVVDVAGDAEKVA